MSNNILGFLTGASPAYAAAGSLGPGGGTDVWQMVLSAGIVVQIVLLILVIFSVVSWGLILAKLKALRDAKRQNEEFTALFWQASSLSAANTQSKNLEASPLAGLFQVAYVELGKLMRVRQGQAGLPPEAIPNLKRALDRAQAAETTRLGRAVTFLATTANTAPFIGLFGTVWGIMDAFRSIGATGAANLATVAPGIAEALVATATGLFAAIPAVVFYNHFSRKLVVLEAEMDSFSQDFLNLVERDLMRRRGPAVEAVRPAEQGMGEG